jgi:transcription initiation factor TFIID subunit 12
MPPKAALLPTQPPPVQDTIGVNPEYMLPHQREQYRRHLQAVTDLQGRKAKEPNNPQIDAAISEARNQQTILARQAQQNEKQYPTPELFQQYVAQYNQNLQQRRAEISGQSNATGQQVSSEKMRQLQVKSQQIASRMKDIEAAISKPEIPEETKNKLRQEYEHNKQQLEMLKELFRNNQGPTRIAAAIAAKNIPETPPISAQSVPSPSPQVQPPTPTIRNAPPAPQVPMQPSSSQPALPPTLSMGQLPRPSVNTAIPPPRPTLTGGYPVGNPLLGTTTPVGAPNAFNLAKDGESRLLSKRKLQDLVKSIDPDERLEPDVEEVSTHVRLC